MMPKRFLTVTFWINCCTTSKIQTSNIASSHRLSAPLLSLPNARYSSILGEDVYGRNCQPSKITFTTVWTKFYFPRLLIAIKVCMMPFYLFAGHDVKTLFFRVQMKTKKTRSSFKSSDWEEREFLCGNDLCWRWWNCLYHPSEPF